MKKGKKKSLFRLGTAALAAGIALTVYSLLQAGQVSANILNYSESLKAFEVVFAIGLTLVVISAILYILAFTLDS
ncbi:hypothetical protein COT77_03525 [Candidatus Berkelbacteria bacterium CG10_big_fil_rev_8_21_14_0_10_41_12]|uniref:Uncharacterized protein n=1 Tax=Candidatus Berkelbacteria bacterium CG10_big_fil_rev_8_21_14_0_10_41_12 TaxID=1974513 RepID=A0A2M6WW42_9BACT|nr:MAG: hypothetical protein COT77_03525 [Candidatus Berkelbacteria bacterium CG10_big_fil_rev_8_21_14_0_10_41_12]